VRLHRFLADRVVSGVEAAGPDWYARSLRLPQGPGVVRLNLGESEPAAGRTVLVPARLRLTDLRDLSAAVERCRRLLDADSDPVAVDDALSQDPRLARLVRQRPGLRVPGHVDGDEVAVRAVLGQQVSVVAAARLAAGLVGRLGEPLPETLAHDGVTRLFPSASVLAADSARLRMPEARERALRTLCRSLASGDVRLDRSAERADVRARLLALPGIGPWTADYIALRALGDPDVFLPADAGVRAGLTRLGLDPGTAEGWRPWRSYALLHLWTSLQGDT
jgi:AraC family transcriptional regulator of adaptative response / DNA-3-methyladenine glycosylase II